MTTLNAYATLAEYKAWISARGLAGGPGTDTSDDMVIETILRAASRWIDAHTARRFYPSIETRYYDVPAGDELDPRKLMLDADLLEVISVTNGDGTVIASTEYTLVPRNYFPYYGIRLKDNSTAVWASNGAGDTHGVIGIAGVWGYHNRYARAWVTGSTAAEALDATETGYDVTAGGAFQVGQIIRFDNELGYVSAVDTNTLTLTRGENSSTAAAHDTGIAVKIWQIMDEIRDGCLMLAQSMYGSRTGQTSAGKVTVTAAGVVIRPEEVPPAVQMLANLYARKA